MNKAAFLTKEFFISIGIFLLALGMITFLSLFGPSRRVYSPLKQLVPLAQPCDAFGIWQQNGVRGRILVLFDRRLNAEADNGSLTPTNYVYVAIRKDLVRKVYHVISDAAWPEVERTLSGRGYFIRSGPAFRFTLDGARVFVTRLKDLPRIDEPVLININMESWGMDDIRTIGGLLTDQRIISDMTTVSGAVSESVLNALRAK